ncbi:hypothetical protein SmJEL517_g02004 [Synchytrium microbalum]|uniref:Uncharacterized protein n=1 Tax=Synchytrium microbalum TaxID=1806994 RepID=A0A507CCW3_9FUNG|nr:uncharacterized protein SmJEL517_g02004 [Synchytrium microbalum]TPX35764.1 hypothetical protein SmJEL517_g02004 [Synchytrium microbalum]
MNYTLAGTHHPLDQVDDNKIIRWSGDGDYLGNMVTTLFNNPTQTNKKPTENDPASQLYLTEFQWLSPSNSAPSKGGQPNTNLDVLVAGGTDGRFYLCSKGGRVEKAVEAHKGALLALRWNYEGSALVTAGEDGQVKIWSRSGMLRSSLAQAAHSVYSVAWSPDNDQVLYTNGKSLVIKPLQPASKPIQWKAHDAPILKVDWNLANNLIISASEDKKYRIWDSFGRQLYSSAPHDHAITSLAWSPNGEAFAVGSYDLIRVCDRAGWSYAMEQPNCGSVYSIAWTTDGTQFACAGGQGAVVRYEWQHYEVTQLDKKIRVHDVLNGFDEVLDFRDRVVKLSLGFGHLVAATPTQCYIYSDKNWNTPAVFDLASQGRVVCIVQSLDLFSIVDNSNGIQIYSYDGRLVSSPRYPGLRPEFLTPSTMSLVADVFAIKDRADEKAIYVFDTTTGKLLTPTPLRHSADILEISISNTTPSSTSSYGRLLAILDKNHDLYIMPITIGSSLHLPKKLGTMVETFCWNEDSDVLAAMVDGRFIVWYHPASVFIDEDLVSIARLDQDGSNFGKQAQIIGLYGNQCTIRRADGAVVTVSDISPFPALLHEQGRKRKWEEAVRLCRYSKSKELWACLAAVAIASGELNTAEVGYAAIDEIQKVQYISYIRDIPTPEGRAAELALLARCPQQAESILLSAGLVFRAIQMWISLFHWDKALDLALKSRNHVDVVLWYRAKWLKSIGMSEGNAKFEKLNHEVELDWETINSKMEMEYEMERKRPGARPYASSS